MKTFAKAADIKVGVVGYGCTCNMGQAHLNEMKRAGMTPTAVVEIDPKRLKVAAQDFPGIETYSSVEAMLRKSAVNVVTLITPHNTHAALGVKCLKAGRHVIAEKPMAITTAECDAMIAAAKKAKVVLSTYHNRHWDGIILGGMQHLRKGDIGKVVRIDIKMGGFGKPGDWWRSSKTISGGLLYDWGVHVLEYTLQMMDSDIAEVAGHAWSGIWAGETKWKKDTNEDEGFVVVRFANGAWSTLNVSSIDPRADPTWFKVVGTKGTMVLNWEATEIIVQEGANRVTTRYPNPKSTGWKFYQNIADHLTKGTKLVITPEWARRPIHILDLAGRSARAKRAMKPVYK
jgi:predicted dehydrogenase